MKILLIAYHYPPMGGAGVQRALKFSRYLGDFGITPVVLAAADPHYVHDASLGDEVPAGLAVHRVPHTPWLGALAARRRGAASRQLAGAPGASGMDEVWARGVDAGADAAAATAATAAAAPVLGAAARAEEGAGAEAEKREGEGAAATGAAATGAAAAAARPTSAPRAVLRDAALATWQALQWPDEMAGWARRAAPLARRLVAESQRSGDPIRLVFSSSPPISAHRVGQSVARSFGLPWVADLRDLWTDNPAYAAPRWRAALDRRHESALLAQAAGLVTVTDTWAAMLAARVGSGTPVAFIPNGYDEHDFDTAPLARPADGRFRLTHAGTFYGPRSPAPLLQGLAQLLAAEPAAAARLRLRLVGNVGARFEGLLAGFERRHPGVIERKPYVPHAQAIAEMTTADALLLVVGGSGTGASAAVSGWLPGKLFEYLRARRPILVLGAPQGEAAAIVRACGAGLCVDETDPAAIAAALAQLLHRAAAVAPATASIERYERRALTARLADFLRQVALR